MLDLYLIPDDIKTPEWPEKENLKFVDGLTLKEFDQLMKLEIIDGNITFWDDFRWTNKEVKGKAQKIQAHYTKVSMQNTTVDKLDRILKTAIMNNLGLVAYCD